jgi:hypothetical protein
VSDNKTLDGGGGIDISNSTLTATASTFSGNRAERDGGGIRVNSSSGGVALTLTNVTVSGNTAQLQGGGLHFASSAGAIANLLNVTVTRNVADFGGGVSRASGTVNVKNTIIAQNTVASGGVGPDVNGAFVSLGNNLIGIGDGSTGLVNGANGNLVGSAAAPINPRLGALQDNGGPTLTHALLNNSPAIDAGNNTGAPATDQRGVTRPRDGDGNGSLIVDIGAFER